MKIEAVIFDLGNVVVPFDWQKAASRLQIPSGNKKALMGEDFKAVMRRFELGEIPSEVFVSTVARAIGFQGEEQEFTAIFNSIFDPNPPMERIIQRLAVRLPLYLLSNTSELHLEYLRQNFRVLAYFTDGVYSFSAKCAKPDPRIFQLAIKQFGVTPETTIYIDDLPANVRSATEVGFHAIRYDLSAHAEFERQLTALGIQIPA